MTKRFNRWLLLSIMVVAVPFWWLLIANEQGGGPAKPVHITDLRLLAASIPGAHPTALTDTLVASRLSLGDMYAAGIGLKRRPLAVICWTLPVPDKGPIVIDPGVPPTEATLRQFPNIDPGKLSEIAAATSIASTVLHTQGQGTPPPSGFTHASYLLGGKSGMVTLASRAAVMASTQPSSFTTAQAVAPGVVVIPTASYAPDTRMIFVQLADGREFLFVGKLSTLSDNWSQLRIRSHLAAMWGLPQDRDETYAWLRTVRQLHVEAPDLKIVPGQDYYWLVKQTINGTLTDMDPNVMIPARHGIRH